MNAKIMLSRGECYSTNWSLFVQTPKVTKSFYLGQDIKFTHRVLQMEPDDVKNGAGITTLSDEESKRKLAEFIIDELQLTEEKIAELPEWALCCQ